MDRQRRAFLAALPAVAGTAALEWPARAARADEHGARSVIFTPVESLSVEERTRHERYMKAALDLAENLPGPFAAVFVDKRTGEIVCAGVNEHRENPIFHGEIVAINACARVMPKVDWGDLMLYTTAEPCPMCMSAIVWLRVPEIVYGTSIEELIRLGINQIRLDSPTVAAAAPFYSGRIVGGVSRERADPMYRSWAERRK